MNNIYDNGCMILGTKEDLIKYTNKLIKKEQIDKEDYEEMINFLNDMKDKTIIAINYDNGMGLSFDWWEEQDIVKVVD